MAGQGSTPSGIPVTPTGGAATLACPRDGQLLGFFVQTAATTVVLNDVATVAGVAAGNQILNSGALGVGWYPFPVNFNKGLVVNASNAIVVVFQ